MKVALFVGSKSNAKAMKPALDCLAEFEVESVFHVLSAHRVPEALSKTLDRLEENGVECVIAGAGLAAHLPGVIASQVILPVIGVPMADALNGLDSLYSIVQMPKPVPVAAVGIENAYNAGMLAVEILALKYPELKTKLKEYRKTMRANYLEQNQQNPFA